MKAFQLDECFNDKKLARQCNSSGECQLRRFPERLKEEKDYVILPDLLSSDAPLLTKDFTILQDNRPHIPEVNSGLIVVRSKDPRKPFTSKAAAINLERLKHKFPQWSETDWSGVYLEIDEEEVVVFPLTGSSSDESLFAIRFDNPNFATELVSWFDNLRTQGSALPAGSA